MSLTTGTDAQRTDSSTLKEGYCFTRDDLKYLQSLPLLDKIQKTQYKIWEWYCYWKGQVYLSFSGGKDSTVLWDMVQRVAKAEKTVIPAAFCDTGLEYPEIREFVKSFGDLVVWLKPAKSFRQVIDDFGYPVISKEMSQTAASARRKAPSALRKFEGRNRDGTVSPFITSKYVKYKHLIDAPFKISAQCCEELKKKPAKKYERETGRKCITAMMASESQQRRETYLKFGCNAFSSGRPISNPMGFWTEQDVLQYLQDFNIPYASVYGEITKEKNSKLCMTGLDRTGCVFCMFGAQCEKSPNRFQRLKRTHPKLHSYCINKLGCKQVLDYLKIDY